MGYVPITTDAMLKAADFWAAARIGGRATAKNEAEEMPSSPVRPQHSM